MKHIPSGTSASPYSGTRGPWPRARILLFSVVFAGCSCIGFAQEDEEETVELNPFVVESDSNMGYYATETLSGTNLRTEMRSLANPISVITEEFMEDIGANSYENVVDFLPSTSTFEGDTSDNDGNTARTGTPFNSRGFRVTQLTQNFFATQIRQDNFNTERLTQSRGPNSVLFGLGSVGGAMDITPKRGVFGRNIYELQARFDDRGSNRFSLDINRNLIEDKLAVRFAALHDDLQRFRDPAFRRRKSFYGNLSWKPFKKTTVHVWGEWGRIDDLNPRLFLAKDSITPYLNSTLANHEKANLTDLDIIVNGTNDDRNAARGVMNTVKRGFNNNNTLIWIQNAPELGVMNWKWKTQGDQPWINGTRVNNVSVEDPQLTPDVYWDLETVPSGPQDQYDTDYYKYGAELQQQVFKDTFLSLNWVYEKTDTIDFRPIKRQEWAIKVDTNWYLPNQSAAENADPATPSNPYYGQPYIESNPFRLMRESEYTQLRANLSHKFDLQKIEPFDGFDLGSISLVGSWYYFDNKFWLERQDEMTTVSLFGNGSLNNTQGRINRRYYLNDPTPGYPDEPWTPLQQAADASVIGSIRPAITSDFLNRLAPIQTVTETESLSFLGQWGMFNNRLYLTGGWREDKIGNQSASFVRDPVTRIWEGFETATLRDQVTNTVSNYNWGVVVRPLPWLDLFYNESTNNVNAGVTNYDIYNSQIPDQTGEGQDMGVRFALLENRLFMKLNYYENVLNHKIANPLRDGAAVGIGLAREGGRIEDFLDAMDFNGLSNLVEGTLHFDEYPGNGLWTDTEDTTTTGYEFEVTANITRDWRFSANVSKMDSALNATYNLLRPWYSEFIAPIRSDAAITSLPADPDDDDQETIGDIFADIDRKLLFHETQVGGQQLRTSTWGLNLVSSYSFRDTGMNWADDIRVGGAYRWREGPSIGYPEDAEGNFDTSRTFQGDDVSVLDAFISKNWRIGEDHSIGVTFRVLNLFNNDGWTPRTAVDDGTGTFVPLQQVFLEPRTFQLTFDFRY